MNKQISENDKLDFYKKYSDQEFQSKLKQIDNKYSKIGYVLLCIGCAVSFVGMFISPWVLIPMALSFLIPLTTMFISYFKQKKLINQLNENITYSDFVHMLDSGELQQIAYQEYQKQHQSSDKKSLTIKDDYSSSCDLSNLEDSHDWQINK